MTQDAELAAQVRRLEERVARLEQEARPIAGGEVDTADAGTFWALEGLKDRLAEPGGVLFAGAVTLPGGEHFEWQQGHPAEALLADDWTQAAAALSALAHPVRLLLLRKILHGTGTAAALGADERLGTTGQLYHHLRQLVSAGWLRATARGHYAVPGERIVPLLVLLATVRR